MSPNRPDPQWGTSRPGAFAVWTLAARPATLSAGAAPVLVGTALAAADGAFRAMPALAALVGAALIQIGTNLFNDYADFVKGADTEARLGPARATQKGWLSPREVAAGAAVAFLLATLVGIYLVAVGGWPILGVGLLSLACGVLYTGGPLPLAYVGLGDLFVMLFFGLAAVCGTYWVQAARLTGPVVLASIAVGALATGILVVNNLRDRETDAVADKRTLVVRFGPRAARLEYLGLVVLAYGLVLGQAISVRSWGWALPALSLPLAAREVRAVFVRDGAALNPHLGGTARLGLVFSLLLSVGIMLSGGLG